MSVATFNPAGITATTAAVRHIGRQMALSGRPCLRLGVKQAGCNGYMYTLDHLDEPGADDQAFPLMMNWPCTSAAATWPWCGARRWTWSPRA